MNRDRFAGLARTPALAPTRRMLLGLAAALGVADGLAAPPLASLFLGLPTAAKPRKKTKRCKGGLTTCKVKKGKKKKTICVDAQADSRHCGGCNQACGAGIACVNGVCQDVTTCTPACPAGRDCFEGACTCLFSGECEGREDPAGEWCVNPPGHPTVGVCGCLEGFKVCAAGERCSNCCSDLECEAANPGAEGIICPSVPANSYLGRFCCLEDGAPCGSSEHCCSRHCDISQGFPGICA